MMENLFGHTWCNCLECDQRVEAFRVLMVGRGNRDDDLMLALVHLSRGAEATDSTIVDTTYNVFGERYYLLHPFGEIQDKQLVPPDEEDDDD